MNDSKKHLIVRWKRTLRRY